MQVEDKGGRIFKSSNRAGGDKNRRRKDKIYIELANFKRSQRCIEVFETYQLLLVFYQIFCNNS